MPGKVFLKIHFGHLFLSIFDFLKHFMKKGGCDHILFLWSRG